MRVTRMICNEVNDDANVTYVCRQEELLKILKRAEALADVGVVRYVVTIVDHGRRVVGEKVQAIHTELRKVIKVADEPLDGIGEFVDVELVDSCLLPPIVVSCFRPPCA